MSIGIIFSGVIGTLEQQEMTRLYVICNGTSWFPSVMTDAWPGCMITVWNGWMAPTSPTMTPPISCSSV